jgi:Bacterial Ig domain
LDKSDAPRRIDTSQDGTFTSQPPVGFTGSDTFTFPVTDGPLTSAGTATVMVTIWYVNVNDRGQHHLDVCVRDRRAEQGDRWTSCTLPAMP